MSREEGRDPHDHNAHASDEPHVVDAGDARDRWYASRCGQASFINQDFDGGQRSAQSLDAAAGQRTR
jgi:hypothetical protein